MFKPFLWALGLMGFIWAGMAQAVDYVEFDEHFVVNVGDPTKAKLSYVRANISLKVVDETTATRVRNHTPFIRDLIVRQLVRQQPDEVRTMEGKDKLRTSLLESIQSFLQEEENEPLVEEVMFTEFLIQE
jgi:flagellar FliL protein